MKGDGSCPTGDALRRRIADVRTEGEREAGVMLVVADDGQGIPIALAIGLALADAGRVCIAAVPDGVCRPTPYIKDEPGPEVLPVLFGLTYVRAYTCLQVWLVASPVVLEAAWQTSMDLAVLDVFAAEDDYGATAASRILRKGKSDWRQWTEHPKVPGRRQGEHLGRVVCGRRMSIGPCMK